MKTQLFVLAMALNIGAEAQESLKEVQYAAYLKASKTLWEKSIQIAEKKHGKESFEKALALYGLLNNTMATKDEDSFDNYKDETINLLETIIEANPTWGEPKAILSSTYGLIMAYNPMKGMFLGMKSSSLMEEALKLQPESAWVQKLYAGSKLYTPKVFGGDPKEAIKAYSKAIGLMAKTPETEENWLYLDAMMGLAMAYRETGEIDKAKNTLKDALVLEPDYYWAKSVLAKMNRS